MHPNTFMRETTGTTMANALPLKQTVSDSCSFGCLVIFYFFSTYELLIDGIEIFVITKRGDYLKFYNSQALA
jgi:hypothetical protein